MHPLAGPTLLGMLLVGVLLVLVRQLGLDNLVNTFVVALPTLPDAPRDVIVIGLDPDSADKLRHSSSEPVASLGSDCAGVAVTDFTQDPTTWRAFHACLLDQLADNSSIKVIAFDIHFSREDVPYNTRFAAAIERAQKRGQRVVLGQPGGGAARWIRHSIYRVAEAGLTEASLEEQPFVDDPPIKSVTLIGELHDGKGASRWVPGLALQAYSVRRGAPVDYDPARGIVWPPGFAGKRSLWLRLPERAVSVVNYGDIVLGQNPEALAGPSIAIVGVVGSWAEALGDVHRLPSAPTGQILTEAGLAPGVFVHAYAANQLEAQAAVTEASLWQSVAIASAVSLVPMLALSLTVIRPDPFRRLGGRVPILARMFRWPLCALFGVAIVLLVFVTFSYFDRQRVLPWVSALAAAFALGVASSTPARVSARASRRLVDRIVKMNQLQGRTLGKEVVNLPIGDRAALHAALAPPALSIESLVRYCDQLYVCLVESEGKRTIFANLPREFLDRQGWVEPTAPRGSISTADHLLETFIGTELRRIRNLNNHTRISQQALQLGNQAIIRHTDSLSWPPPPAVCLRAQLSVSRAACDYTDKVLAELRKPLAAGNGEELRDAGPLP